MRVFVSARRGIHHRRHAAGDESASVNAALAALIRLPCCCRPATHNTRRRAHSGWARGTEAKQVELLALNTNLELLITQDGLTGVKNRRAFHDRLGSEIAVAMRYGTELSLLLIDVDFFKHINDTFGHPAGDIVLQRLALLLQQNAREVDMVARYGGEEFAVILPHTGAVEAVTLAERLRQKVEGALWVGTSITISVGVSTLSAGIATEHTLLVSADQALYTSKHGGRNRVTHAQTPDSGTRKRDAADRMSQEHAS